MLHVHVRPRAAAVAKNNDSYIVWWVVPEARACARRSNGRVRPIGGYGCVRHGVAVQDMAEDLPFSAFVG